MGMDQTVAFGAGGCPAWSAVADVLARRGLAVSLAMIDGELSFPDETPTATWRELRVKMAGGMVTVIREATGVKLVVWGNADARLLADRDTLAAAFTDASR